VDWWVKVAVRYWCDPKVAALPDADTELMFVRSVASDHAKRAGGFIPESALPELARRRRYAACVDNLVSSGLWSRVDGGYQITRWADWQNELDALEKRRAADRDRKRAKRADERASRTDTRAGVRGLSADASAEVQTVEGERDREGEVVEVGTSLPVGDPLEDPPSPFCRRHPDGTDDPCGGCGKARTARKAWDDRMAERLAADKAARQAEIDAAPKCVDCGRSTLSAYHGNACQGAA
jgi:hypothetical protein